MRRYSSPPWSKTPDDRLLRTPYIPPLSPQPDRSTLSRVLQLSLHDPLKLPVVARVEQRPRSQQQPPPANGCFDTLTSSSVDVFVGEDAVVRRLVQSLKIESKCRSCGVQYMIVYFVVPVVTLKMGLCRASVSREVSTTYPGFHHPSLEAQQTCLRAVVQVPRVTSEAHPPRTDPLVNLGQQVLRFSDGAPQVRERKCLTVLLPRSIKTHLLCCRRTWNCYAHDLRPAHRDGQTKFAEDFDEDHHLPLQPAQRPRRGASVVGIQHSPSNSTPCIFQCHYRAGL